MGLIALDIDGTVTMESRTIPSAVSDYLASLYADGWAIAFVTGRTYGQCHVALERLSFPFYLAVQNGATLLSMPDQRILFKHYLSKEMLLSMSALSEGAPSDVVVYSGFENEDICYYRPKAFNPDLLSFLARRRAGYGETWYPLDSFADLPLHQFASTKSFGALERLVPISEAFENELGLQAPINRDPFAEGYYVMQTTPASVHKGRAVNDLRDRSSSNSFVIAAGDDLNDLSLLRVADVKIAMANAPQPLLDMADIVAPLAAEQGIIVALTEAIQSMQR